MKRVVLIATLVATISFVGSSYAGGPVTKQNGSEPVISSFTPICAVAGYADYGLCGGDVTKFGDIGGKMNAVQPKQGTYNLAFSFTNLTPGVEYRLLATRDAVPFGGSWLEIGRSFADETGALSFKLTTEAPGGLGFDLNRVAGDVTLVTTWWSGQHLVVNPDSSLSTAA